MTDRVAGKRGASESHRPELLLSNFKTEETPAVPSSWDGSHGIVNWGMDGNDKYGCCGAAATDHGNMAKAGSTLLYNTLGRPKFGGTLPTYFAYGRAMGEPGQYPDQGVQNASWLGFLYENGIIDGYAEVPIAELKKYAVLFNGILLAVALDDDAEQEFENHIPWGSLSGDRPDPSMGHDIWLIGYKADGSIQVITWGAIQNCTAAFRKENITDAWVILDEEDAKRAGVSWTSLQAALTSIHGVVKKGSVSASPAKPSVFKRFWGWLFG